MRRAALAGAVAALAVLVAGCGGAAGDGGPVAEELEAPDKAQPDLELRPATGTLTQAGGPGADGGASEGEGADPVPSATPSGTATGTPAGPERVCDRVDDEAVEGLLGGPAEAESFTNDTCTITRVDGTSVGVVSVTVVEWNGALPLTTFVDPQAESLDADGVADPVEGPWEEAYALQGDLGTYVHAVSGDEYVITFVTGTPDDLATADTATRLVLPG